MDIISEDGCVKLIEAVYWQCVKDIVAEWRYAEKHNEKSTSHNYQSAVAFLRQSGKGRRILFHLKNCTDEQRAKLIRTGLTIDTGVDYDSKT